MAFFTVAEHLAKAWIAQGQPDEAIAVLEYATQEAPRTFPCGAEFWLNARFHLAELYREVGRSAQAQRLFDDLRGRMQLADPDFWLVEALSEF